MAQNPIGFSVLAGEVAALQKISDRLLIQGRGINSGDVFANEESLFSTCFFPISTLTVNPVSRSLFSAKAGDVGVQGLPAAAALTDAQTNWNGNGTALSETEAFVGLSCGFEIYIATGGTGATAGDFKGLLADPVAFNAFGFQSIWTWKEANLVERNQGCLIDYPYGSGSYSTGVSAGATVAANNMVSAGVQNGGPMTPSRDFNIPIVWKPLVNYSHKVTLSTAITFVESLPDGPYDLTNASIAVRMRVNGYRLSRFA